MKEFEELYNKYLKTSTDRQVAREFFTEVYNLAIQNAADNAIADCVIEDHSDVGEFYEAYVIKNSILDLKIK